MKKLIARIAAVALIAAAVYVGIAFTLVATDRVGIPTGSGQAIDFAAAVTADYSGLPGLTAFVTRDGTRLGYRRYGDPATARHGASWCWCMGRAGTACNSTPWRVFRGFNDGRQPRLAGFAAPVNC